MNEQARDAIDEITSFQVQKRKEAAAAARAEVARARPDVKLLTDLANAGKKAAEAKIAEMTPFRDRLDKISFNELGVYSPSNTSALRLSVGSFNRLCNAKGLEKAYEQTAAKIDSMNHADEVNYQYRRQEARLMAQNIADWAGAIDAAKLAVAHWLDLIAAALAHNPGLKKVVWLTAVEAHQDNKPKVRTE